jgi:hypothetical protein
MTAAIIQKQGGMTTEPTTIVSGANQSAAASLAERNGA